MNNSLRATAKNGDCYADENYIENGIAWFLYWDKDGNLYESKESPAYYIKMDNACQAKDANGKSCIAPITIS